MFSASMATPTRSDYIGADIEVTIVIKKGFVTSCEIGPPLTSLFLGSYKLRV